MTRTPSGGAVVATALVIATLTLLSCSDENPSPPPPSSSSTTTASASPTVTAPALPPAAAVKTPSGAEAFVGYFWDLYNHMYLTGTSDSFLAVTTSNCSFCLDAARAVDVIHAAGGRVEGGETVMTAAAAAPVAIDIATVVAVTFRQGPGRVLDADGNVTSAIPSESPVAAQIRLVWSGDVWRVDAVAERASS